MRVYISGPMTGLPEFNHPAFCAAAAQLEAAGYEVINPAESDAELTALLGSPSWHDFMAYAVHAMETAQAIAYLPGWRQSYGARVEAIIAEKMDLAVIDINEGCPIYLGGQPIGAR